MRTNFEKQKKIPEIEWESASSPVPYDEATRRMEGCVEALLEGAGPERIWCLEHPSCYTVGTRTQPEDLLEVEGAALYPTSRGGLATYHGPGQLVGYLMMDLRARGRDVRRFVWAVEEWIILTLKDFGVQGIRRPGMIGVWVASGGGEPQKIAAIGLHLKRWVSSHGFALNISSDLACFDRIVPCGIKDASVTSLHALGCLVDRAIVEKKLRKNLLIFLQLLE